MINPSATRIKLDDLAGQIAPRDSGTAMLLRDLGEAVTGGPTAETWAFSNIRTVVDPDRVSSAIAGDPSADVVTRGLEFLRNSLVLLPLAITWFGIALAVDAYYKLISARPDLAGQSFIYLWQGGFQGRMPLPLGILAIIDAILLAGVFLLTLLAYTRSAWVNLAGSRYGAGFSRALSEALAEAELILAPYRGTQYHASIQLREQNAQDLLRQIADERGRMAEMSQQREQDLSSLNNITDNLKDSAVVFLNAAQSLGNTHTATLAALNGVTGTVKGLAAAQEQVMKALMNVAGRIEAMVPQRAPESFNAPPPRIPASTGQSGGITMTPEQQRSLQESLRRIEILIAAQQESLDKLRKP